MMKLKPYYDSPEGQIYHGSSFEILKRLPDESVNMCVTSPPYWGLRDYQLEPQIWDDAGNCEHIWNNAGKLGTRNRHNDAEFDRPCRENTEMLNPNAGDFCQLCNAWRGSLGLEPTPELYIKHMVEIFAEVKRVLRADGTIFVNMGDSYASNGRTEYDPDPKLPQRGGNHRNRSTAINSLKPKDLVGVPWMLAFALRNDGWYLRSAIPWIKKNGMPESVKDRPCIGIEYIFLMSKNQKYYYDNTAVKKVTDGDTHARYARGRSNNHKWSDGGPGNQSIAKSMDHMIKVPGVNPKAETSPKGCKQNASFSAACKDVVDNRERRVSDWFFESFQGLLGDDNGDPLAMVVNTSGFSGAHFAVFPERMVEPCILAGCPKGGTVLDPFFGSGTTGIVTYKHDRKFIGIELSQTYLDEIAIPRIKKDTKQLKLF